MTFRSVFKSRRKAAVGVSMRNWLKRARAAVQQRKRIQRGLAQKTYTYRLTQPIPIGNVTVLSSTYASVLNPYGGTGIPTVANALYGAGSPGTEASFSLYFQLQDCPQYSTYTALYDQYKITKITVVLQDCGIVQDGVYSTSTQSNQSTDKTIWYVVDYDDASPISRGAMMEYQNAKMVHIQPFNPKPIVCSFVPHIAQSAYRTGGFTGYANSSNRWLDTSYPDIQHYGFKFCFSSPLSASESVPRWSILVKYQIAFKNVK